MAYQRIGVAFGTSLLGTISVLLSNLWLFREIAAVVGKKEIGLYGLVSQIVTYLWILQLGLDAAASQAIAAALGRGEPGTANRVYHQLARFNRYVAMVCAGVVVLAVATLAVIFRNEWVFGWLVVELTGLMGLSQVIGCLNRTEVAALGGSQRLATVNLIRFGQSFSAVLLAILLLRGGWGIVCQPAAELMTQTGGYVAFRYARRASCEWYVGSVKEIWEGFYSLARYAFFSSLSGLAGIVDSVADVLILQGTGGGLNAIAFFTVWHRAPTLVYTLTCQLLNSAFPSLTMRYAADPADGSRLFLKLSLPVVGLCTLIFVGLGLWLAPFVHLWVQGRFDLAVGPLIGWLAGGMVCIRQINNLMASYVNAVGETAFVAWSSWAQCLIKIVVALALVPKYGVAGLYAAYLVCSIFPFVALIARLKWAGLVGWEFLIRTLILTVAAGVVAAGIGSQPNRSLLWFAIGVIFTTIIWASIAASWKWMTRRIIAGP